MKAHTFFLFLLFIFVLILSSCAAIQLAPTQYAWQPHQGKNISEMKADHWECEKDSKRFGNEYHRSVDIIASQAHAFYQCMEVKGWTLTVVGN